MNAMNAMNAREYLPTTLRRLDKAYSGIDLDMPRDADGTIIHVTSLHTHEVATIHYHVDMKHPYRILFGDETRSFRVLNAAVMAADHKLHKGVDGRYTDPGRPGAVETKGWDPLGWQIFTCGPLRVSIVETVDGKYLVGVNWYEARPREDMFHTTRDAAQRAAVDMIMGKAKERSEGQS